MSRFLATIGIFGTLAWLAVIAWIFGGRMSEIGKLNPNEIGDFLAGSLGPLGILWLILGFFQQGQELRDTARALHLQSEQLRVAVQEQRELLIATRSHVEADRAAVALAREQQQQLLLPRFVFLNVGLTGNTLHFDLRNLGANASDVHFVAVPAQATSPSSELPVVMTGLPYPCTLVCASGHPIAGDPLVVGYRDLVGHHGSARFTFAFDAAGKLLDIVATGD
ncbi:MAG: hypothetical protein ABI777_12955 [Betaproteobacteria bacterium]